MENQDSTFYCANCKKTLPHEQRSDLSKSARKSIFITMNQIAPTGNKTEEICKRCKKQVVVWIGFLVLLFAFMPVIESLRDGTY